MRFDQIATDLETTLSIMEKDRPEYSADFESTVRALGTVYFQMGNFDRSLELRQRLLKIAEFKVDRELIEATLHQVFETALKARNNDVALSSYRRIRADFLPSTTCEQADLHLEAAAAFSDAGFVDEAMLLYVSILSLVADEPESETRAIRMTAWQRLGSIYESNGLQDEAIQAHENVLEILTLQLGPDHGGLISYIDKVVSLYGKAGRESEVSELQVERRRLKKLLDG